jgi:hypothetical protein
VDQKHAGVGAGAGAGEGAAVATTSPGAVVLVEIRSTSRWIRSIHEQ